MLKRRKPRTPGQRHTVRIKLDTEGGSQYVPLELRKGKLQKSGRNQRGRITVRHRGGGKKRLLRKLLSIKSIKSIKSIYSIKNRTNQYVGNHFQGTVVGIQYDPNRTGRLALLQNRNDIQYGLVLAAEGLKVGDMVSYTWSDMIRSIHMKTNRTVNERVESKKQERLPTIGSTRKLDEIPVGSSVFNIELVPGKGGKYVRSAGTVARLLRKPEGKALIRLPSGTRIQVSLECTATIGRVAGEEHRIEVMGKAGRIRNKGWRPTVRGEAINPIDHPHGGRTRGGRPEYTPWARFAKGKPTRNPKKKSRWVVLPN